MKSTKMKMWMLVAVCCLVFSTIGISQGPLRLFDVDEAQELTWKTFRSKADVRIFSYDPGTYQTLKLQRPALLNLIVPNLDGTEIELELLENTIYSPGFTVTNEKNEVIPYKPGLYYKGKIKNEEGSFVAISLFDNEVMGVIARKDLSQMVIGKSNALRSNTYMLVDQMDMDNPGFKCLTEELPQWPQQVKIVNEGLRSKSAAKCVDVYFEIGNSVYAFKNNNVQSAADFVSGLFNGTSSIYSRESVSTSISQMRVWTSAEPFSGLGFANSLASFNGDLAHYVKMASGSGASGVAYLPGLCGASYAYSELFSTGASYPSYSWNVNVITHEMGHNLGSPHTQSCTWPGGAIDGCYDQEGSCAKGPLPAAGKGTIMSYCHLVSSVGINFANGFGPLPGAKIRDVVNGASCISDCSGGGPVLTGGSGTSGGGGGGGSTPTNQADLNVSSISVSPNSITSVSTTFNLAFTVANEGTASAVASVARVYFSSDATVSSNDQTVLDASIPSLNVNANANGAVNSLQLSANSTSGTYYFIVCADVNAAVTESSETNNCNTATVTLTLPNTPPPAPKAPAPDLTMNITSSIPASGTGGSQFSFTGYIQNIGDGIAASSSAGAVISSDGNYSSNDLLVYSNNSIPTITPDSRANISGTINIPDGLSGNYEFIICADVSAKVNENNEENNCVRFSMNIQSVKPELYINKLVLDPPSVPVNSSFIARFETGNSGSVPSGGSTTGVYLSSNTVKDNLDQLLFSFNIPGLVGAGTRNDQVTINTKINPGNYYIIACTDINGQVEEGSEANNCVATSLIITNPLPDFEINAFEYPTAILLNGEDVHSVKVRVKNIGTKKSEIATSGYVRFGPNQNQASSFLVGTINIPAMDINQIYDTIFYFNYTDPGLLGDKYFIVCLDLQNKIVEINENNNCQSYATSVVVPTADLKNMTGVNYNESIGRGGKMKVPFQMTNIGTKTSDTVVVEYYLSNKPLLNSGNRLALDTIKTKIRPGDTLSRPFTFKLPSSIGIGSYYLNFCIDYNNKLTELTKTNNCQSVRFTVREEKPDLTINNISVPDSAIVYGKANKIKLSISNIGEATALNSTTRLYYRAGNRKDSVFVTDLILDTIKADKTIDTLITFTPVTSIADSAITFEAIADILAVVNESKENNNSFSYTYARAKKLPDIIITNLIAATEWKSEEAYEIKHTLFNPGLSSASDFQLIYNLSDATKQIVQSDTARYVQLNNGDSISVSFIIKPSVKIKSGAYILSVVADKDDVVSEINENNNQLSTAIVLTQKQPDISIDSIFIIDTIQKGTKAILKLTVTNKGDWKSEASVDDILLSLDKEQSADDINFIDLNLPSLEALETKSIELPIAISEDFKTNTYYLLVTVDQKNISSESDETNNSASVSFMVPNKKADLVHEGLIVDHGSMKQGDTMHLMQLVKNIGETVSGDFEVTLYIKKKPTDEERVADFKIMAFGNSLKPNGESELESLIILPDSIQPGLYYLIACIDPSQKLDETILSNNCGQLIINVEKKENLSTSIKQKALFESTLVYPNPTNNLLNVVGTLKEVSGKIKVDIRDYTGRIVTSQYIHSDKRLSYQQNIQGLHAGWYIIEFNSDKGAWRQPFLKF